MFDFTGLPTSTEDEDTTAGSQTKLDMNLLLEKIDMADYGYYDTLSDKEKKHFQPYIVLRWVSSLDDSVQVTYNAKKVEGVFNKWSGGGKEALNELKDEFNNSGSGTCVSVAKYEHAKYDWRIKFAVQDIASANALIDSMKEFGITGHEIISLIDSTTIKYHIIMLNDMVNQNFWEMKNHPELVYQLMCSVSEMIGPQKRAHNWLSHCKGLKNVDKAIFDIIKRTQSEYTASQLNEAEYKILLSTYTKETFEDLLKDLGTGESEIKTLLKHFKSESEKYGKNN
ncbi:hypothetical protein pEaSNUABM50_00278 [Erwinia phage pEa_SNUABM_50]|uniref:Uncharacterized protein n=4 Tax=Eneladusvirus BF TaxID=2560751 RepID=A0A7L8ZMS9_9CAUD|nr:hypothetical protein FDH34_gp282 [Serratia phage BF]QOI71219.1 hypothetical protein pEaSNUABM12_00281 [Erwinia phage pEa_SNUABM_12]QOI71763.1 hypothetical protein pEaSNUABM47_00279 [Erwinia phage pEa_SNUABM_47]QOI72302.1 hypothetical protein pEaSNUABM50_00278 [Erwinia phage pEa_SNUABM_50]QXO11428.1 hypothetical protein pEaSNUABM19_00282 [Erwinia phage pEa_SNUABM_19]QXO11976.1 hypothetical protein pEaSNUABM44_00280 [Erwinia phage pEa_SNUABM_44]QXO12529.1 hypothetical protein pEaSNUABM49_002